ELGGDPTDLRAEIAVDLAELGLVGGVVVMAASRRADLLQRLFVNAVDHPALHHRRLVALPDANRLDGDFRLSRFAGGGRRIDTETSTASITLVCPFGMRMLAWGRAIENSRPATPAMNRIAGIWRRRPGPFPITWLSSARLVKRTA